MKRQQHGKIMWRYGIQARWLETPGRGFGGWKWKVEEFLFRKKLHPWSLTWNLKITCLKRKIIFQIPNLHDFGFHVNFQRCNIFSPEYWPKPIPTGKDHLNQPLFFRGYCMSMLVFGGCIDVTNFLQGKVEGFGFQGGGVGLQKQFRKMSIPIGSM